MSETQRIRDQIERAFHGDAWYGSPTFAVLEGITPEQASARPIPQAHSIWEIVLHMTAWTREAARRLRTGVSGEPEDGDWREVSDTSERAWRAALEGLEASYREMLEELAAFPEERLDEVVGDARDRPLGSGVSFYVLLHGIVQHTLAHTAQISLLRKFYS